MIPNPRLCVEHGERNRRDFLKDHDIGHVSGEQVDDRTVAFVGEVRVEPDVERRDGQLVTGHVTGGVDVDPTVLRGVEAADRNLPSPSHAGGHTQSSMTTPLPASRNPPWTLAALVALRHWDGIQIAVAEFE